MNTAKHPRIPVFRDLYRGKDGRDVEIFSLPLGYWRAFSEPASGPPPVADQAAGFHTAGATDGGSPGVTPVTAGSVAPIATEWRLMLITVLLVAVAWVCTSCTNITTDRNRGTSSYTTFLGNAKIGELGPEGLRNAEIDNATGGAIIERTAEKIGKAWAWGKFWDFASQGLDELSEIVSDNNATDQAINADNNATKKAIETFVPPEPEPVVPTP